MKKIIVLFCLFSAIGFTNNTFTVHIGTCNLHIPDRYKLKEFNAPHDFRFTYLESPGKDLFSNDNFILKHNINVYSTKDFSEEHNEQYMKKLHKILKLVSKENIRDLKIFRFKNFAFEMNKKGAYQETAKEFFRQTNVFIIIGQEFKIYIEETNKYIEEIYNMIEDCN